MKILKNTFLRFKNQGFLKILAFGNETVEQDSLPIILLPKLKELFPNIEFNHLDGIEEIEKITKTPIIIDTVKGIKQVQLIQLEDIKTQKVYSMHDFDLGYNLLLLKKLNLIDNATIIGIPMNYDEEKALEEIKIILSNLPARNE